MRPLAMAGAAAMALLHGCPKSCSSGTAGVDVPSVRAASLPVGPVVIAQPVYDGGLKSQWMDFGWSKREVAGPGPARVDFSKWGGWILAKPSLPSEESSFGGLTFRMKMPPGEAELLEVRLESSDATKFPRLRVPPQQERDAGDGWQEVVLPMSELDPDGAPFDKIIFRAFRDIAPGWASFDKIGFVAGQHRAPGAAIDPATARRLHLTVDCRASAKRISPGIYGIAYDAMHVSDPDVWTLGATMRRWGGNPTSRYNWELGAWNTASDWYFENVKIDSHVDFLKADAAHHVKSALTVPTIGWVAKDTTSSSFPVGTFGPQQATDPYRTGAGNGKGANGKAIPPGAPTLTSVPAPPDMIRRWVEAIRKADAESGARSVDEYILDNEPALWNSTHRDVHPEPMTYDELLEKTIAYGSAIRAADPDAVIAGPASWGWPEYMFSAKDAAAGFRAKPDRRAHGDVPLTPWLLQKLHEHEQKTGVRVLDVLDMHFYPQEPHVYGGDQVDPRTNALRIRSTRALWDPTYKDESWIDDTVMLLPRMKGWIAESYPGRAISIGEYNFGGEKSVSGALAEAEALGRFGQQGVASAFYWTYPHAAVAKAFRAFRDFDGRGGHFQDFSMTTVEPSSEDAASIFASRDEEGGHLVLVFLNLAPDTAARASIQLDGCSAVQARQAFTYEGGDGGFVAVKDPPAAGSSVEELVAPYSITVIDLKLQSPAPGGVEKQ